MNHNLLHSTGGENSRSSVKMSELKSQKKIQLQLIKCSNVQKYIKRTIPLSKMCNGHHSKTSTWPDICTGSLARFQHVCIINTISIFHFLISQSVLGIKALLSKYIMVILLLFSVMSSIKDCNFKIGNILFTIFSKAALLCYQCAIFLYVSYVHTAGQGDCRMRVRGL